MKKLQGAESMPNIMTDGVQTGVDNIEEQIDALDENKDKDQSGDLSFLKEFHDESNPDLNEADEEAPAAVADEAETAGKVDFSEDLIDRARQAGLSHETISVFKSNPQALIAACEDVEARIETSAASSSDATPKEGSREQARPEAIRAPKIEFQLPEDVDEEVAKVMPAIQNSFQKALDSAVESMAGEFNKRLEGVTGEITKYERETQTQQFDMLARQFSGEYDLGGDTPNRTQLQARKRVREQMDIEVAGRRSLGKPVKASELFQSALRSAGVPKATKSPTTSNGSGDAGGRDASTGRFTPRANGRSGSGKPLGAEQSFVQRLERLKSG